MIMRAIDRIIVCGRIWVCKGAVAYLAREGIGAFVQAGKGSTVAHIAVIDELTVIG